MKAQKGRATSAGHSAGTGRAGTFPARLPLLQPSTPAGPCPHHRIPSAWSTHLSTGQIAPIFQGSRLLHPDPRKPRGQTPFKGPLQRPLSRGPHGDLVLQFHSLQTRTMHTEAPLWVTERSHLSAPPTSAGDTTPTSLASRAGQQPREGRAAAVRTAGPGRTQMPGDVV